MSIVLGAKFPDTIVNKVDNYVSKGSYLSRSDAVRDLIRRGLVSKAREDQEGVSA
ncbi:CopG family ribbon-helix-helix protein [Methanosarcina horonobensis]|uniref:CopG family ribbon-helix-helix protein n=1 Tax=Methanosarcina horonobensis TaxID=418008 RepID=UPI000A4BB64F|nr:ribbon-helix-helix domain-containing protein [Methanosarcina horonobensis]